MKGIKGRRVYPDDDGFLKLKPGDYGKETNGVWMARPPGKVHMGCLVNHTVVEHADGTITVSPSILITQGDVQWHGYLKQGIWEET